jgi:type VI secretion system secreted protein Hcp
MKSTSALFTSFFATVLLVTGPASAAWFLKIEGVAGGSTDVAHKGWIELESFSLGAQSSQTLATGQGLPAGKTTTGPLQVTKKSDPNDKSAPILYQAALTGRHFQKVILEATKSGGGQPYLRITMENCIVSSIQMAAGGDRPTDSFSINFTKILFEDLEQQNKPKTLANAGVKAGVRQAVQVAPTATPTTRRPVGAK